MRRPFVAAVAALAALVVLGTAALAVTLTGRDDGRDFRAHPMMGAGTWDDHGWDPDRQEGSGWMHGAVAGTEFAYLTHMVAHHREAVEAAGELERSDRPQMRAFGRTIVATQTAQIIQMKGWLADWYPGRSTEVTYRPMMRDLSKLTGNRLDRAFLADMVGHHMTAVMMSQQLLARGVARHDQVNDLAGAIRDEQHAEIFQMRDWLADWFGTGRSSDGWPMGTHMGW